MPELFITANDRAYIKRAIEKADWREVGGLGIIEVIDGVPTVNHMRLLKQTVSSGEVEWDEAAHADYLAWLYTPEADGGAGFEGESYGLYSWHSHGSMSVFYSSTDEDFIAKVGSTVPYMFSTVFNKKGDEEHRLDIFRLMGSDLDSGPETITPVLGGQSRILYGKDTCRLTTLAHETAVPYVTELGDIEAEYTEKISKLQEERDAKLKVVREKLTKEAEKVRDDVKERLEADFKEYVEIRSYGNTGRFGSSNSPKTTTSSAGSAGSSASGKPGKDESGHQGGKGTTGNDTSDPLKNTKLQCWDKRLKFFLWVDIAEILSDSDLLLCKVPDEDQLKDLNEAEIAALAAREILSKDQLEEAEQMEAYGWYGGYC